MGGALQGEHSHSSRFSLVTVTKKNDFPVHIIKDIQQIGLEELQDFSIKKGNGIEYDAKLSMHYWKSSIRPSVWLDPLLSSNHGINLEGQDAN